MSSLKKFLEYRKSIPKRRKQTKKYCDPCPHQIPESKMRTKQTTARYKKAGGWDETKEISLALGSVRRGCWWLVTSSWRFWRHSTSTVGPIAAEPRPPPHPQEEGRQGENGSQFGRCLHLYLLEEGSRFALDNWLQQRASPLAGGGSLWQVWTRWLYSEPLSLALQASASSGSLGFITDFDLYTLTPPHQTVPGKPETTKVLVWGAASFQSPQPQAKEATGQQD